MRSRGLLVHALLALGGMTAAYMVWTSEDELTNPDAVTIVDCDEDALERVELTIDDKAVTLELTRGDDGLSGWFTVVRTPEEGEPSTRQFAAVGGEALTAYLDHLTPLRATRSLGELSGEELEPIGLDEPAGELAITCGGERTAFTLGGRSYGNGDRYGRDPGGGPVYLIPRDSVQPLESAEHQLMQRSLHSFEWTEVGRVQVSAFDRARVLLQRNRQSEQTAQWVDAEEPDRRNELYGNWLALYRRLRVQDYLEPGGAPGSDLDASGPVIPVMTMEIHGERGSLDRIEIARVQADERAYYGRTQTTQSWVRLPTSVSSELEEDLRPVLGLEPLEPPPEPEPTVIPPPDGASEGEGAAPTPPAAPEGPGAPEVPASPEAPPATPPPAVPPHGH